jgi:hypothetical protein
MKTIKSVAFMQTISLVTILGLISFVSYAKGFETKSSRENMVRVDVTPLDCTPGKGAKFQIRMNTHSVDLAYDVAALSTLKDDQGREYRPVSWQGSPPGGHHRSGILEFPALEGNPNRVTLVIKDIADVPERTFEWKLE